MTEVVSQREPHKREGEEGEEGQRDALRLLRRSPEMISGIRANEKMSLRERDDRARSAAKRRASTRSKKQDARRRDAQRERLGVPLGRDVDRERVGVQPQSHDGPRTPCRGA